MPIDSTTLEYRVGQIEKRLDEIDLKIDKILIERIPTLNEQMQSLQTRINVLTVVNIGALLLAIIINRSFA